MSYALCDIKECAKHDNCKRFNVDAEKLQGYRFEFNKICNNENGFTYLIEKEKEIINIDSKKEET